MLWFGPAPFAPICDVAVQVATPIDPCGYCDEPFTATDNGVIMDGDPVPLHQECMLRMVVGSIAHQTKACSCFAPPATAWGGPPEEHSKREEARAAVKFFHDHADARR